MTIPDLSKNTHLTRVHLPQVLRRCGWIEDTCTKLQVVSFTELFIEFNLTRDNIPNLDPVDWDTLDTHLARLAEPREKVSITFSYPLMEPLSARDMWWSQDLESRMAAIVRNGLPRLRTALPGRVRMRFIWNSRPSYYRVLPPVAPWSEIELF